MSEIKGIYALWYRETKVFLRERSRIISSVINPLLWLLIIGGGLGSAVSFGGINYQTFIYPGILIQTALFSSVFFGVYIVWDKKIDFMKEVLVAPMRRTSIFVGKILGGSTDTLLQVLILFVIGFIFMIGGIMPGLQLTPFSVLVSLAFLLVVTVSVDNKFSCLSVILSFWRTVPNNQSPRMVSSLHFCQPCDICGGWHPRCPVGDLPVSSPF